jgi:light-regulated signal transduction histidine kinase (bacteriophytochrome)
MNALFRSLIDEIKQNMPSLDLSVTIEPLAAAYGDLALIKLMVSNLLSNAIKFSGKQENIKIHIGCLAGKNESIYYIKDNGIGFDMKNASELFNAFHRLHNSLEYEGTGIGLALSKRILDKHEGRIWAESEPGEGAVFYFALPERIVT